MSANPYTAEFYAAVTDDALRSARVVAPLILACLGEPRPRSVVDVGCGAACWLSVFQEHGVERVLGLDGDHLPRSVLKVRPDHFRAVDLSLPFGLERERFDLAMSLEVAEHLPARSAEGFIASLCRLAPLVLFSAAIPGQGGTDHVNEQWPWYWRHFFSQQGFRMFDPIRPVILHDARVSWWYRQNLYLFVKDEHLATRPWLAGLAEIKDDFGMQIVAPQIIGSAYYRRP